MYSVRTDADVAAVLAQFTTPVKDFKVTDCYGRSYAPRVKKTQTPSEHWEKDILPWDKFKITFGETVLYFKVLDWSDNQRLLMEDYWSGAMDKWAEQSGKTIEELLVETADFKEMT